MKKTVLLCSFLIAFGRLMSQSDVAGAAGHVGLLPIWYVGWNAATPFSLNVAHNGAQNINFRTNFGLAPVGFGNRMIITNGLFGPADGQIAMGNNLPNAFIPTARLHLHQSSGNGQLNVFADDLSNGVYSYALVADGQVIDTKKMVKTQ